MSEDGSMARLPEIIKFAKLHNLKVGTVSDLIKFRLKKQKLSNRSLKDHLRV